jgi:hypothetical protein
MGIVQERRRYPDSLQVLIRKKRDGFDPRSQIPKELGDVSGPRETAAHANDGYI